VHFGVPWPLAILTGIVLSSSIALLIGALAVRTRGIYFAMVTLALAQCVYYIFHQAEGWTGGENGLRGVNIKPSTFLGITIDFQNPLTKYFVMLAFVAAALYVLSRILASPFGAVLEAIREREARAVACGYDAQKTKLMAFVMSGAFCGLAGALNALHLSVVPLETLHYETSGMVVMMALLGGMGTLIGPFIGAFVYLVLKDSITVWTEYWQFWVGLVFIFIVLRFPAGILGTILEKVRR
jgi:branched-chain amino acid transport system permease protein